jgi:hypothetical protein
MLRRTYEGDKLVGDTPRKLVDHSTAKNMEVKLLREVQT